MPVRKDVLTKFDSPDDEHWFARNMQRREVNKYIEKSASIWLLTRIIPRCTFNEIYTVARHQTDEN